MSFRANRLNENNEDLRSPNSSFVSSNMSKASESDLLNKIFKLGLGMLFPPLVIVSMGMYAYFATLKSFLLIPVCISIISVIATIALVYLARQAEKTYTRASNFLMYSLYIIHLSASSYFFIGFWLIFAFKSESDLPYGISVALLCIEGACLKYIIGYGLIFVTIRKLTIEYQSIRNYLEIIQLTSILSGIGICLTCIAFKVNWNSLDISYHVPPVVLNLGIVAGLALIFLSVWLFYAAYSEKLSLLLLGQIFSVILLIFLFLYSAIVKYSNEVYQKIIERNCVYLLKITNSTDLQCEKYVDGDCARQFLATVWEEGLEKTEKCINPSCCEEIQQEISWCLEILMVWAFLAAILLLFSWLAGQGLVKKIEKYGKASEKGFDLRVFAFMVTLLLLSFAAWFSFENSPRRISENFPILQVIGGEYVDSRYIAQDICRLLNLNLDLEEEFDYLSLETEYGTLSQNEFKGKKQSILESLSKTVFCPSFITESYEIVISLTGVNT